MKVLLIPLFLFCISAAGVLPSARGELVRVQGSASVAMPLMEAARVLRRERNLEVEIKTTGGSMAGIAALGEGTVDVGLSSKPLDTVDRANYPAVLFNEIPIGGQATALAVSRDVWVGGVHALSPDQIRDIYEGKVRNWKAVGGPDLKISMFMSEPGQGLWEMFAQWLYQEVRKAPVMKYPKMGTYEAARDAVEFTPGSFSQIPFALVNGRTVFAVAIREKSGETIEPTVENCRSGKYPLFRHLNLLVNDRPTLGIKVFVDFMLGTEGQALVKKASLLTVAELHEEKR